jgi:hypothetical protein
MPVPEVSGPLDERWEDYLAALPVPPKHLTTRKELGAWSRTLYWLKLEDRAQAVYKAAKGKHYEEEEEPIAKLRTPAVVGTFYI